MGRARVIRLLMLAGGDLAGELVAPCAEHVGPGLDVEFPRAPPVDVEARRPADAAEVGVDPRQLGLGPVLVAGTAMAHDGPQQLVAVAEDVGRHLHRVPDAALGRIRAAVDRRRRVLDDDPGRFLGGDAVGRGLGDDPDLGLRRGRAHSSQGIRTTASGKPPGVNDLSRSSGIQLHITSLPGGRLGPEAYRFVDWLASAGQSWWQVLPLGPPDRYRSPYTSSSAFAAWPGLLADRRASVSAAEIADFRERQHFWIGDWERFSVRGAVADQVRFDREWGKLRAYARDRG